MNRNTLRLACSALILGLGASTNASAWNCGEERNIERTLDIGKLQKVMVKAGAGELLIEGGGKPDEISIEARLCASSAKALADMDVITDLGDDAVEIVALIPHKKWSGNHSAAIDLQITVPPTMVLDVQDSSGDTDISHVASLTIVDSSGDLDIEHIDGDLTITDSSGEIDIRSVNGSVELQDSSGDIDLRKISRNVTVNVDSSGDIEMDDVGGSVLVKVDSSGSIDVDNVGGSFKVLRDGSGGIRHSGVKGGVSIPDRKK